MTGVRVLVGTRKGAFTLTSDGKRKTSLDDDDDDGDDDDETYTRSELKAMQPRQVKKIARGLDIDTEGLNNRSIINAILEEQE